MLEIEKYSAAPHLFILNFKKKLNFNFAGPIAFHRFISFVLRFPIRYCVAFHLPTSLQTNYDSLKIIYIYNNNKLNTIYYE